MNTETFPEDALTLLGADLRTQTPEDYHARITGYYSERLRMRSRKELPLKGNVTQTATKKREGSYVLTYGLLKTQFSFTKERMLINASVIQLSEKLSCPEKKVLEFLLKKKFSVDATPATP